MTRRFSVRALLLMATVALAACSDYTGSSKPRLTGQWLGAFSDGGTLYLDLNERDGIVTGGAQLSGANVRTLSLVVTGTFNGSTVALTLMPDGLTPPVTFSGTFRGDTLAATVNRSGSVHEAIRLTRRSGRVSYAHTPTATALDSHESRGRSAGRRR